MAFGVHGEDYKTMTPCGQTTEGYKLGNIVVGRRWRTSDVHVIAEKGIAQGILTVAGMRVSHMW